MIRSRGMALALLFGVTCVLTLVAVAYASPGGQSGGRPAPASRMDGMVTRLWELQVDPAQIDAFRAIGVENTGASVRLEPGVLMMHAVQLADAPAQARVLEVYASQDAYEAHLRTPHFLAYKAAAGRMVRSQRLVPVNPVALCAKGGTVAPGDARKAMVRIAVIGVDPAQLDAYKSLLAEEQEASVRREPGVLMLHSVQYAEDPSQVRLLEVYASPEAYASHIRSPHFLKYKLGTARMVRSLELLPAHPVMLAAKAGPPGRPACM